MNREFEVLYEFMEKLPGALKPGGRAAILTFHSGEDKLVKKALKAGYKEGIYSDYSKDVIRPSARNVPRMDAHGLRKCAGRLNRSKRDKYAARVWLAYRVNETKHALRVLFVIASVTKVFRAGTNFGSPSA